MLPTISPERFSTLVNASKKLRIAVLGDLMLDTYIKGTASRLSQEAPVPVLRVRDKSIRLGGAANVMRNLKALSPEAKIFAFGVVGVDEPGEKLRALLAGARINTNGIVGIPGRVTIEKQRVIAGNQQIVRMDFEETAPIDHEIRDRLIETLIAKIRTHELDAIVIEDYAKGLIGQEMLDAIVSTAAHEGIFTSLDPHPGNPVRTKGISLMTPNRAEAFALAGVYCSDPANDPAKDAALQEVAAKIHREWSPDVLLITLGHQGMALYSEKEPRGFVIPTIAREVFDVSGAGDTVISAFTLYHAAGATDRESAMISNQAAGIVVGKAGTATTNPAEIAASFKRESESDHA